MGSRIFEVWLTLAFLLRVWGLGFGGFGFRVFDLQAVGYRTRGMKGFAKGVFKGFDAASRRAVGF